MNYMLSMSLPLVVLLLALVCVGFALYQTRQVERSSHQKKFLDGSVPNPLPNGSYKGKAFIGLGKNWQGKVFDSKSGTGTNQFTNGRRYSFKTYPQTALCFNGMLILKACREVWSTNNICIEGLL